MILCAAKKEYIDILKENDSCCLVNILGVNRMTMSAKDLDSQGKISLGIYNMIGDKEIDIKLSIYNNDFFLQTHMKVTDNKGTVPRNILLSYDPTTKQIVTSLRTNKNNTLAYNNALDGTRFYDLINIVSAMNLGKTKPDPIYDKLLKQIGTPIRTLYNADGDQCWTYVGYHATQASIIFMLFLDMNHVVCGYYYGIVCHNENVLLLAAANPGAMIYNKNKIYTLSALRQNKNIERGCYYIEKYQIFNKREI